MDARDFLREGRLSFGALGEAVGMDANDLLAFLQNAIGQFPVAPIVEVPIQQQEIELEEIGVENDNITIVPSLRGKEKAVHRGFQFRRKQRTEKGTKQHWKCDKDGVKDGSCKALLHTTVAGNIFCKFVPHSSLLRHNHGLDPMAVPKRKFIGKAKDLTRHELQSAPLALGPSLSNSAIRKQVRRVRIANQIPVVEGRNVEDVDIPRASQMYTDAAGREQLFLLGDSGRNDPARILLFGKQAWSEWSAEMKTTYWDGSFSVTPAPFYQLYAILAERSERVDNGGKWVFPVLYALLMDKSAHSYTKMMRMIREQWPAFSPSSISMDFEQAAIRSAIEVFPQAQIAGCLFHLVKNFKKQIRDAGLNIRYRNPNFAVQARMIMSLAFVPPEKIWEDFETLRAHLLAGEPVLAPVLDWFGRNYVGTAMNPPLFPVNWWSCYERTLAGEDRTNNFAEAAHRRFHDALGVDHPTVGRLIQDFKVIQRTHDMHYEQYLAGIAAPRKRQVYVEADARILVKVLRYESANLIEYLRGLAYNITMDQ